MPTKKVKRKHLNIARTLVLLLFLYLIICLCLYVYKEPVQHIHITGSNLVSDAEVIEIAGLKNYPSFVSVRPHKMAKKIATLPLIREAQVSYGWDFTINIELTDNTPLFLVKNTNQVCLADGTLLDTPSEFYGLPTLLNQTPDKIMKNFAAAFDEVDAGIRYLVSEIQYTPSYSSDNKVIDENRFLLTMSDNNTIYITTKKLNLMNKYLDIIASSNISGTLYLDGDNEGRVFKAYPQEDNDGE